MNTKLTLKICLLFLTGLAINRLPSDILADPPLAEAAAKSKADESLPDQGSVCVEAKDKDSNSAVAGVFHPQPTWDNR